MSMKAARIHAFGPPEVIFLDDIPKPVPAEGQLIVQVEAAGVGPWDAWIRSGKSALTMWDRIWATLRRVA